MQTLSRGAVLRHLLLGVMLLLTTAIPAMAQGEITVVSPGPELPGVPDDVPVTASLDLNLPAGDYQWQTTTAQSLARDAEPITVHNGFVLSLDQDIVVQKAGAASRPLPAGSGMPVTEGERIKPVATGDPGFFVIVELVAVADLGDLETPDQVLPLTLEDGQFTIALLDITNLDGIEPGDVIEQAAGPAFSIANTDAPTAELPLVVWLASIFRTGAFDADTDVTGGADATPEIAPTATATSEPDEPDTGTSEDDDVEITASPDTGDDGPRPPSTGDDETDTLPQVVLPGVPDEVPVLSSATLDLTAGDYQWQSREITTLTRSDEPLTVGDGFIVAVDAPVTVLRAGAASFTVQPGTGAVLTSGDRILPISSADEPVNIVIIELVLTAEADPAAQPDQILPLTLADGTYTIALLDLSAIPPDGPTAGEIIGGAAGPGFGISTNPDDPADLIWLVAIFPA